MKKITILALASLAMLTVSCRNSANENEEPTGCLPPTEIANDGFDVVLLSDKTDNEGVRTISVQPTGVCSSRIDISVKDSVILSVKFTNGCPGNTQGVAKLVKGMMVEDAISELQGIDCASRGTSCPDQLSRALRLFL